jgi:hypothetical protein
MTADKQRARGMLGKLSAKDMKAVEQAIKIQLGMRL